MASRNARGLSSCRERPQPAHLAQRALQVPGLLGAGLGVGIHDAELAGVVDAREHNEVAAGGEVARPHGGDERMAAGELLLHCVGIGGDGVGREAQGGGAGVHEGPGGEAVDDVAVAGGERGSVYRREVGVAGEGDVDGR